MVQEKKLFFSQRKNVKTYFSVQFRIQDNILYKVHSLDVYLQVYERVMVSEADQVAALDTQLVAIEA